MRKSDSTEDRNLLRWVASLNSGVDDELDYLSDWFNLAEQQEYDEAFVAIDQVPDEILDLSSN